MGGAGHMLHAIKSLKANRELLKKRKMRKEGDYKRVIDPNKPVYKKATPLVMKTIRSKIERYKAHDRLITIIAAMVTLIIIIFFYWFFSS